MMGDYLAKTLNLEKPAPNRVRRREPPNRFLASKSNSAKLSRVATVSVPGQSAFGINSVSLKKGYREKESASDAQQSTCEFRPLLRRQMPMSETDALNLHTA
jgi:hypothetical protein